MLALVVDFRVKPPFVAAFEQAISHNAQASLDTEPGCRQFDVCRDQADPTLFFLYEFYDDEAAIQAHLRAPHFLAMSAATAEWVESKRVRQLVRQTPNEGNGCEP
jgi:(4S)-4-hydroxy-5-phosphonooxypentane-2,3-dione isomerase